MNATIKRAFKGWKIETKELIDETIFRYVLSDGKEKFLTLCFPIPDPYANTKQDKAYRKAFSEGTAFLNGLGFWRKNENL
ncbi:MAG: hypothetical protein IIY58_06030 [Aeriscardovia sp.]|nr:hypothetical protein [Aeriscardovia sp.]